MSNAAPWRGFPDAALSQASSERRNNTASPGFDSLVIKPPNRPNPNDSFAALNADPSKLYDGGVVAIQNRTVREVEESRFLADGIVTNKISAVAGIMAMGLTGLLFNRVKQEPVLPNERIYRYT